jgi:hypothetical protein
VEKTQTGACRRGYRRVWREEKGGKETEADGRRGEKGKVGREKGQAMNKGWSGRMREEDC